MSISPSSFYNSFGSKERLYREAVETYLKSSGEWFLGDLDTDTDTKTAFQNVLNKAVRGFSRTDRPSGCMISLAGTHVPPRLEPLREMMIDHRRDAQNAMATRIREGIANGDVPADTDVDTLAAFLQCAITGAGRSGT